MITTTTQTIHGWNVEVKHYNDRQQTVLFRIKDKGHTTSWQQFTSDDDVATVIRAITDTKPATRLAI